MVMTINEFLRYNILYFTSHLSLLGVFPGISAVLAFASGKLWHGALGMELILPLLQVGPNLSWKRV